MASVDVRPYQSPPRTRSTDTLLKTIYSRNKQIEQTFHAPQTTAPHIVRRAQSTKKTMYSKSPLSTPEQMYKAVDEKVDTPYCHLIDYRGVVISWVLVFVTLIILTSTFADRRVAPPPPPPPSPALNTMQKIWAALSMCNLVQLGKIAMP